MPQSHASHAARYYFLPLMSRCGCGNCAALGCINESDRTETDLKRALARAVSGEFEGLLLPAHALDFPLLPHLEENARAAGLKLIIQAALDRLTRPQLRVLQAGLGRGWELNVLLSRQAAPLALLEEIGADPAAVYFTLVPDRHTPLFPILDALPEWALANTYFYFPHHLSVDDGYLGCREVYETVLQIQARRPGFRVRPPLGTEVWDPRADRELCLEPTIPPAFASRVSNAAPRVSVLVPSYNNRPYLKNTVRHLLKQNLPRVEFEIIVIDDGSDDGSQAELEELIQPEIGRVNFKYIYSHRPRPRAMGDANYRAGISRNLGVKHACGEWLCFLDSDILTPPDFLEDLLEKHREYDVIQCKRLNLTRAASSASTDFGRVNPKRDTFVTEGGYWEKWHETQDWMALPFFWKYVCTYGLSLRTDVFKRVGWLKRTFIFYGFEDTELGYRLAKAGLRFHLNDMVTYHLFHQTERSEFFNSDHLRQTLLGKTARIFYLNSLDPDVYEHFRSLMSERLDTWRLPGLPKMNLGRFKKPVYSLKHVAAVVHGATFWRVRVAGQRTIGTLWRLKGVLWKLKDLIWSLLYPVRKIGYFLQYQFDKRIAGRRAR